ncbi:hypothetical protein [Streptomyces prunicolor]|uniref:hypothetical protein n=1 Tax=Streptomyces prunicolor TaxID=67348 RepID=UPI000370054C|nr:hypothetical protein [Streptomyces prunicolor]
MRKLKKATMVAIGLAASLTSAVALAAPASAETNIRGTESWDTDKLLMTLCTGNTGLHNWFIDTRNGSVVRNNIDADQASLKTPAYVEQFTGYCSYPQSSSWTWAGPQTQISNQVMNCGYRVTQSESITKSITKTSTTTNSVGGSAGVEWNILKDVLSVQATASYEHTWSWSKASTWTQSDSLSVPPRTKAQLNFAPLMRTVRSNPIFHVTHYMWEIGGDYSGKWWVPNTWRGRGYKDIKSYGAYYDAKANVINPDGSPVGTTIALDHPASKADCGF